MDLMADLTIIAEIAATGARLSVPIQRAGQVQTVVLAIPPGIQDGAKLRLRGLGVQKPEGGAAGDLYITIHIRRGER
jgi:DnaJ-class molecular chaperone